MVQILKILGIIILCITIASFSLIGLRQDRKFDAPYPKIYSTTDSSVVARARL